MTGIFKDNARRYLNAGLPVVPCKGKQPLVKWDRFTIGSIPEEEIKLWEKHYPDANLAIVLGLQTDIVIVDIEPLNPQIDSYVSEVIGDRPRWNRRGSYGYAEAFRKPPRLDGYLHYKFIGGVTLYVAGHLFLAPPSIHPETNKPFTSDNDLWEIKDDLAVLPMDFESKLKEIV